MLPTTLGTLWSPVLPENEGGGVWAGGGCPKGTAPGIPVNGNLYGGDSGRVWEGIR